MLYSPSLYKALVFRFKWAHMQARFKKYLPFYTASKKNSVRHKRDTDASAALSGSDDLQTAECQRKDVVSRLATPVEALEVLRSLRCSLSGSDSECDTILLRLWTRLDVKRIALRGVSMVPHPVGPSPRVVAICEDEEVPLALECGAAYAGLDSILERIAGGWTNFDSCVTTIVHMPKLVKVARILGPKKLMPNIKEGTLANNLLDAVRRLSSSKSVQFRAYPITTEDHQKLKAIISRNKEFDFDEDNIGVIEVPIANVDASFNDVIENSKHLMRAVLRQRPTVAVNKAESQFQWPPVKKDVNSILEDAFSCESVNILT
ncbi:putative ribosomal protein L1 [Babesia divergens]|uniref:Ribosomal protein L1 n=1 Tax=Babesia divergens TaxID=32595 RepID=A0AAD9LI62_BABDI|nr:putative ribosomal protein L1 [Babesia divergens]